MYSLRKADNYSLEDFQDMWDSELSKSDSDGLDRFQNMSSLEYLKQIAHQIEDMLIK